MSYHINMCRAVFFVAFVFLISSKSEARVLDEGGELRYSECHGVEYPILGCFSTQPPFTNTRWLPQSPDFVGTTFELFTQENSTTPTILSANQTAGVTRFNAANPTKILVHGFLQHKRTEFLVEMTRALLEEGAMNVIIVGWSGGAGFPYGQAVANTRLVGAQITLLLSGLQTHNHLDFDDVHLIGHSLGAHVAGYVGSGLSGRVGRITALDPAQPNYHGFDAAVRLDQTDAILVDVIHTDGEPYDTVHGYGMVEAVGHIDFYPNGGRQQPGCLEDNSVFDVVQDAFTHGFSAAESGISCSHERSTSLFIASIASAKRCSFTAVPCESEEAFVRGECTSCGNNPCPVMGLHTGLFRARGVFYLNTTGSDPYCGYHHIVTVTLDDASAYAVGSIEVKVTGERGQMDWTEIKSGELNAGDTITKVILTDSEVGNILSMEVKFTKHSGYFSWSVDRIVMRRATAASPLQGHPLYYCPTDATLEDGESRILTGGSYTPTDCL